MYMQLNYFISNYVLVKTSFLFVIEHPGINMSQWLLVFAILFTVTISLETKDITGKAH